MRCSAIAILVAGVLVSGPAFAGTQRQQEDRVPQVSQLERRADALQSRIVGEKLGANERNELRRQQREIRKMIEQLETGGAVDPEQMDRIQGQ
jgi:TolA-binding protein